MWKQKAFLEADALVFFGILLNILFIEHMKVCCTGSQ